MSDQMIEIIEEGSEYEQEETSSINKVSDEYENEMDEDDEEYNHNEKPSKKHIKTTIITTKKRNRKTTNKNASNASIKQYTYYRDKFIDNGITRFAIQQFEWNIQQGIQVATILELEYLISTLPTVIENEIMTLYTWLVKQSFIDDVFYGCTVEVNANYDAGNTTTILSAFEAQIISSGNLDDLDVLMNAAGPIWTVAFIPTTATTANINTNTVNTSSTNTSTHQQEEEEEEQEWITKSFSVGCSRIGWPKPSSQLHSPTLCAEYGVGSDIRYLANSTTNHANILQIWQILIPFSSHTTQLVQAPPSLVLTIGFESCGPIWSSAWSNALFPKNSKILGIIAIVCGDGLCRILIIPSLVSSNQSTQTNILPSVQSHLEGIPLLLATSLPLAIPTTTSINKITSVSWDPSDCTILCCGHADGNVSLWKVDIRALLLKQECLTLVSRFCDASSSALASGVLMIRTASVCPYQPQLIVSGGYDCEIKIWLRTNPHKPTYSKHVISGWIFDTQWDPCGYGLYGGGAESSEVWWDPLWSVEKKNRSSIYNHITKHGGVWKVHAFVFDGQSVCCSVSSDGSVFMVIPSFCNSRAVTSRQLFRCENIYRLTDSNENMLDRSGNPVAKIFVNCMVKSTPLGDRRNMGQGERMPSPSVAMHSIDSTTLSQQTSENESERVDSQLLLYGGASGLLRLHRVNPVKLYFGSN